MSEPTREAVFGDLASTVSLVGECWLVPLDRAESYKLRTAKYLKAGGAAASLTRVCEDSRCVHPDHLVRPHSDVGRMLYIKEHSYQDGDCRLWQGMTTKTGVPTMPLKREGRKNHSNVYVQRFVYQQEHQKYDDRDGTIKASCGKVDCVSHLHVKCIMPPEDGRCPVGHLLRAQYTIYCATCAREKHPSTCDTCGFQPHPAQAPIFAEVGCWMCRRAEATAWIKRRIAELASSSM